MPMVSREMIADSITLMVAAHAFDAMVLVSNCDKVTPGMLMAAGRLNIPTVIVPVAPWIPVASRGSGMLHRSHRGRRAWSSVGR